jgi:hypothetical protein
MLLVALGLGLLFVFSIYRIAIRSAFPRGVRGMLIAARFCLIGLIVLAFFEPSIVIEQFSSHQVVPVLVDVSKSMQIFAHDQAIFQTISALRKWNSDHAGGKQKFVFYRFGDSARALPPNSPLSFADKRSFLPEHFSDKTMRMASSLFLISDGNLSNAAVPAENYLEKNVMYLPLLVKPSYQPSMQIYIRDFPSISPADSPLVAGIELEGYSSHPDTIIVRVAEDNRTVALRTISVPAGIVKKGTAFHLAKPSAGRHLFSFDARLRTGDQLSALCSPLSVLPDRFSYFLSDTRPSLDQRFIRLALQKDTDFFPWHHSGKKPLDLLVVSDWNDPARTMLNSLTPEGTVLFIGCIPCSDATTASLSPVTTKLTRPFPGAPASPFDDLDLDKIPPPSQYSYSKDLASSTRNIFVAAVNSETGKQHTDTANVLFSGRYKRFNFIACAAKDVWRWDFLPLAIDPEEGRIFGFSQRLIRLAKEFLINGLSNVIMVYPAAALSESDSLTFKVEFPSQLPIPSDIRMAITFSSAACQHCDTTFMIDFIGNSHQLIRLKPLFAGQYCLKVSATVSTAPTGLLPCSFPDSVHIDQNCSEYSIQGQNIALLRSFAQPLDDFSEASLRSVFFSGAEMKRPEKKTILFNRNWPLLLMIFIVWCAEWILRRIIKAE